LIFGYPPHLNSFAEENTRDPLPCPKHASMVRPTLVASVFLKEDCNEVIMRSGRTTRRFQCSRGFHLVQMDLSEGKQSVAVQRSGREIMNGQGTMEVSCTPQDIWNYNLYVIKGTMNPSIQ